jgi:ABC-type transporter MlaC component
MIPASVHPGGPAGPAHPTEERSMIHRKRYVFLAVLGTLALLASVAQASPMAELQVLEGKLTQLARQNASDAVLKAAANQLLDYDLLAQNTLRDHWASLTGVQRTEFSTLFRQRVEKKYLKGIRSNVGYTVTYLKETISGQTAVVTSQAKGMRKGRVAVTDLVYKMRRQGGRWIVYDVITDEVSLELNYRNSFNRIIKDKGFGELIVKLKKAIATP